MNSDGVELTPSVSPPLIVGDHLVGHRLVGQAGLDLVLAHAGDAQRLGELGDRVRDAAAHCGWPRKIRSITPK